MDVFYKYDKSNKKLWTKVKNLVILQKVNEVINMTNLSASHFILFIVLIIAVFQDIKTYKIKNKTILAGISLGIILNLFQNAYPLKVGLINKIIVILVLYIFYRIKAIGAGDVKLYFVCAFFVEYSLFYKIICISFVLGAIISIIKLIVDKEFKFILFKFFIYIRDLFYGRVRKYEVEKDQKKSVIHFSIPIFLAVIINFCI